MDMSVPVAEHFIEIGGSTWSTGITYDTTSQISLVFRYLTEIGSPPVCIMIHSTGGNTMNGIQIGEMIRSYPGSVQTHATSLCKSAAATILLSGTIRTAAPGALIGFHASSDIDPVDPNKKIVDPETTDASKDHIRACVGADTFKHIEPFFNDLPMVDLSAKEALAKGLLTHPCYFVTVPPGKAPFRIR